MVDGAGASRAAGRLRSRSRYLTNWAVARLSTACRSWGHRCRRSTTRTLEVLYLCGASCDRAQPVCPRRVALGVIAARARHSTGWRGIRWYGAAFDGTSRHSAARADDTAGHSMPLNQMARHLMARCCFRGHFEAFGSSTRWHCAAFDGTQSDGADSMARRGIRWRFEAFGGSSRSRSAR